MTEAEQTRTETSKAEPEADRKEPAETRAIGAMSVEELRKRCTAKGLPTAGNKKELIRRLELETAGQTQRYAGRLTRCKYCPSSVQVRNTQTTIMPDGRTMVVRSVCCTGRHRHTYSIKEVLEAAQRNPEPEMAAAVHETKKS